jgi:hypothetical protein
MMAKAQRRFIGFLVRDAIDEFLQREAQKPPPAPAAKAKPRR